AVKWTSPLTTCTVAARTNAASTGGIVVLRRGGRPRPPPRVSAALPRWADEASAPPLLRPRRNPLSDCADPRRLQSLVIERRRFADCVGERRIRRNELREIADLRPFLARQNQLFDERRCVRTHCVRAEDLPFLVADKLHETARRAIDDGAIDVRHFHFVRRHV